MNLDKLEQLYQTTPDNIHQVGMGYKIKNGIETDEIVVVFGVEKKLDKSLLSPDQLLPSTVVIEGTEYKTDVIENKPAEFNICFANQSADPTNSYYSSNPWVTGLQTNLQQPLQGGFQITQWPTGFSSDPINPSITYRNVGTLGFFAIDSIDNRVVGVTNTHVLVKKWDFANERDLTAEKAAPYNIYQKQKNEVTGQEDIPSAIYEPGNAGSFVRLGYTKRYSPFSKTKTNYVDCSLVALTAGNITNKSYQVYQDALPAYEDYMPFASTSQIDQLLNTKPEVYSTGRTTGPKGYKTAGCLWTLTYSCASSQIYNLKYNIRFNRSVISGFMKVERLDNVTGKYYDYHLNASPPAIGGVSGTIDLQQKDKITLYCKSSENLNNSDVTGWIALADASGNLVTDIVGVTCMPLGSVDNFAQSYFAVDFEWSQSTAKWNQISNNCGLPCPPTPPATPGSFDKEKKTVTWKSGLNLSSIAGTACKMRIKRIKDTSNISGYIWSDLIVYEYAVHVANPDWPSAGGDSGSALIANFNGVWKIIGLCFAGNQVEGFACRIDRVADTMKIKAWLGTENPAYTTGTPSIIVTETFGSSAGKPSISYNGEIYYQGGLTETRSPLVT
jgi:hypothetical protein